MKFLVVGLGSMGKRRVRDLLYLKAGKVTAFDVRRDRRKEAEEKFGIRTHESFEEGMNDSPGAIVISTPPHLHGRYVLEGLSNRKHVFCEVPLSMTLKTFCEAEELSKGTDLVIAPSCSLRFHSSVKVIKRIVDSGEIGKVLLFTYHQGQYLPDWHPWEDYRSYYVASRETGGGRDIVLFELDWIKWVLGDVRTLSSFARKLSDLEAEIDDCYSMLLEFKSAALAAVEIDIIQRVASRHCTIAGEEGTIVWDGTEKKVKVYTVRDKEWRDYPEGKQYSAEQMYLEEMSEFVKAVRGEACFPNKPEDGKKVLQLLLAIEESSRCGTHVSMGGVT